MPLTAAEKARASIGKLWAKEGARAMRYLRFLRVKLVMLCLKAGEWPGHKTDNCKTSGRNQK